MNTNACTRTDITHSILQRYENLNSEIATICARYQQSLPVLLAVSKKQSAQAIRVLLEAGHRHFAENRVQEAQEKWPALLEEFPDTKLHLIGPLQSNKTTDAAKLFHTIHTLDRASLRNKLTALDYCPELLIQVNTGEETQKSGVLPNDVHSFIDSCAHLPVSGLMCIPPTEDVPGPHFAFLKQIAQQHNLEKLSMGMSNDWQHAIALGAKYIRVGTTIFGSRES